VLCTWWLNGQTDKKYVRQSYSNWSNSPAKSSPSISPASPMKDFRGYISDAPKIIIQPNRLATKSFDLNPLSVGPKRTVKPHTE